MAEAGAALYVHTQTLARVYSLAHAQDKQMHMHTHVHVTLEHLRAHRYTRM
jgi:hypothetical protein